VPISFDASANDRGAFDFDGRFCFGLPELAILMILHVGRGTSAVAGMEEPAAAEMLDGS